MEYWLCRIGSLVCHQVPDRTIPIGNNLLPLCARCTGIYTGFFIGLAYQFALWQNKIRKLPALKISILSSLVIVVLIFDAVGSYLQIWTTPNHIKLILGLLGGSSISLFLFPPFNFSLFPCREKESGMTFWWEYTGLIFLLGFAIFFIMSQKPIFYYPVAVVSIAGILLMYSMLITTIIARIPRSINQQRGGLVGEKLRVRKP